MNMVQLKNGKAAPEPAVKVLLLVLRGLTENLEGILALYELNERCKNPKHPFFSKDQEQLLVRLALVTPEGHVHEVVRDVVLSTVEFKGDVVRVNDPLVVTP